MPTSYQGFVTDIINKVIEINPKTVLDVGCGFGKWGFLCREYLDIRMFNYEKKDWKVKIDCIEIWKPYISDIHKYIYNEIILGSAFTILNSWDNSPEIQYDLIIACDIIEHLEKDEGLQLIKKLKEHCNNLIITLPLGNTWGTQGAICGNIYETHKSEWFIEDLIEFNHKCKNINGKDIGLFTWSI